jgi:hypothetical protein
VTLFVYLTEDCQSDAQTHSLTDELDRFREKVEDTQSTSLFDPFPPPYLVKKKIGGRQGRLIADLRPIGDHAVIVFLAIMIRGDRAYEVEFSRNPRAFGEQHFANLVSDEEIRAFVDTRTRIAPPAEKPQPSEAEYGLLYGAFSHHGDVSTDILVCETKQWVDAVAQERVARQLAILCKPCLDALGMPAGLHFVPVNGKPGWGVWALCSDNRLLLLVPSTDTTVDQSAETARQLEFALRGADSTEHLRASRRAYPAVVLADDDLWIELEKEPVANIALSPEESEVLESARHSSNPFPLFINGRAGSGKSTILQYLFADLLFNYLSKADARGIAPPIYLTANSELLRVARNFVERLLRSEATLAQQGATDNEEDRAGILDQSFREFYGHMLSLIPAADRKSRFARTNRIDYARFRAMWHERFGKDRQALRNCGPDISWHVIRSYIKGMSSETYLEPDDYAQLPENQLTVTQETYQLVYDKVWQGWYREVLASERWWDDQDLTRYVLDNELAKPIYPAVFCDEAQDFTRIELELLLRINLFSARSIPVNDLGRVCFAFAGDQFQTLNPTGFRWDAIKATFVEKFVFELDPGRQGRTELNYRELQYNYRSSDKIVRFGNHVQALRASLFGLTDLKPQTPWTIDSRAFPVTWFRANDALFWKHFRDNPSLIVIVPCEEGAEAAFVQGDPFLREHVRVEDGVPHNVLSASRAKGCEYPAVVVYGFGAASDEDLVASLLDDEDEAETDPGRTLPLQYFVNRLYVAVSRPKRRLVIVDTEQGLSRLWKCALEEESEAQMLLHLKRSRDAWAGAIQGMTVGMAEDLSKESAGDPLENAKAFEADGRGRRDSFLMRQAAQAYRSAGDAAKARECRARALEFEAQFIEAGQAFFEAGYDLPDGLRCLWQAGRDGWRLLAKQEGQYSRLAHEIEFKFARLLSMKPNAVAAIELVDQLAERLADATFADGCIGSPIWRDALAELLRLLMEDKSNTVLMEEWRALTGVLERLQKAGVVAPPLEAAAVHFLAGRYAESVALWEKAGSTRDPRYSRAKAYAESYPQRVVPLSKLEEWAEIVRDYSTHPEVVLSTEQAGTVVHALCSAGRMEEALAVGARAQCTEALFRLAQIAQETDPVLAQRALCGGAAALVTRKDWDVIGTLFEPEGLRPMADRASDSGNWTQEQKADVTATIVRAMARLNDVEDAPAQFLRNWQRFLREYLRVKDGQWTSRVSLAEAGAAIERAGRFTDAISFYEAIRSPPFSEKEKRFAKQRWLVSKERQLKHELQQGASGKTRQIERDLKQAMASVGVRSIDELGAYPVLKAMEEPGPYRREPENEETQDKPAAPDTAPANGQGEADLPRQVSVTLGQFDLELSRRLGRLNITNKQTMETAFAKLGTKECGGEVQFIGNADGPWNCDAWHLTVHFPVDAAGELVVTSEENGVSVRFHL